MNDSPSRTKLVRLVALVPEPVRDGFIDAAERGGETGSGLLRRFMVETVERSRRGETLVPRLTADAPVTMEAAR